MLQQGKYIQTYQVYRWYTDQNRKHYHPKNGKHYQFIEQENLLKNLIIKKIMKKFDKHISINPNGLVQFMKLTKSIIDICRYRRLGL